MCYRARISIISQEKANVVPSATSAEPYDHQALLLNLIRDENPRRRFDEVANNRTHK